MSVSDLGDDRDAVLVRGLALEQPGRRPTAVAALVSIAVHGLLAVAGAVGVARGLSPSASSSPYPAPPGDGETIVVDLPAVAFAAPSPVAASPALSPALSPAGEGALGQTRESSALPSPPPVPAAGGALVARPDDGAGRGGDLTVTEKARNLAARADADETHATALADAKLEQENRLDTARQRTTFVDRRYALQPMELTFVVSGKGFRYERRPVARVDSASGTTAERVASSEGGERGERGEGGLVARVPTPDGDGDRVGVASSAPKPGSHEKYPAKGAVYGTRVGAPQTIGMAVARARPHVDKGKPSVTGDRRGSPADTSDAELAVAEITKGYAPISTPGADEIGDGRGGSGGDGEPAAGGGTDGAGSRSSAFGAGPGPFDGARDSKRTLYNLTLQKRLGALVDGSFPREQEIELRNGTVIVDITIEKSGKVSEVLVHRPSGFKVFDTNVVMAIRGASFDPVPDILSRGAYRLRIPVQGGWRLQ